MAQVITKVFKVPGGHAIVAAIANAIDEEEFSIQWRPDPNGTWTDLFRNGKPIILNNRNTTVWLTVPGEYRAVNNTPIYQAEVQISDAPIKVNLMVGLSNE